MDINEKISRLIKLVQDAQKLKTDKDVAIDNIIKNPNVVIFNLDDLDKNNKHDKIIEKLSIQVRDFDLTIDGLTRLKNITGMKEIKEDFLHFINTTILFGNPNKDKCGAIMIQGDPGCGKTTISKILATIIYGIGFLNKKENIKDENDKIPPKHIPFAIVNHIYEKNIQEKDEKIKELETTIVNIRDELQESIDITNKIKGIHDNLSKYSRFITDRQKNEMKEHIEKNSKGLSKIYAEIKDIKPVENTLDAQTKTTSKKETMLIMKKDEKKEDKKEDKKEGKEDFIIFAKKNDIVGEYIGHTPAKVEKLLERANGKVLVFDECYNIIIFEKTDYGIEAINMINEAITTPKYNFFAIFIGYKKLIEENLFDKQPGLKSRIDKIFVIKPYTYLELVNIFTNNLNKLEIDPTIDLNLFFEKNIKEFPQYGRDVIKFIEKYIRYIYASEYVESLLNDSIPEIKENYVTDKMFKLAFKQYTQNNAVNNEDYLFYVI